MCDLLDKTKTDIIRKLGQLQENTEKKFSNLRNLTSILKFKKKRERDPGVEKYNK